jgi:hypothetical protein
VLALRVVRDLFVEGRADALHNPATDLSLDEHRVDHRSAILGNSEV